ncbi:MAG: TRAP transporter substrate-binding protein DctP [Rhodospirillaceae bacterium]
MIKALFAPVAALAFAFASLASAQEAKLSAVSFVPNNNASGKVFVDFVDRVNAAGKGMVQIEIKAAGSMSPFTMANAVKTGVVDMANLPTTFYQNLLPIGDALKMIQKTPQEMRANGAMDLIKKIHLEKAGLVYLGHWGSNVPFHLYMRDKKIDSMDLSGLKLRITPVYRAFFKALGATVIQTPPGEVYVALERGTIDGLGWPTWDIKSLGWDKHIKYRVEPAFYNIQGGAILNVARWNALSAAQRTFLTKQMDDFEDYMWVEAEKIDKAYRKEQDDAGIQPIVFTGKLAEAYLAKAYEAGWQEAMELDPENAPKLKALIAK